MIGLESLTAAGVDKELKYYVYMLCNPLKDDEPFYVGKGSGHRAHHHVKEAKSDVSKLKRPNLHKINTIKQILSHGSNVIIKYIDIGLSENVAFELEEFLIPFIGRKDLEKGQLITQMAVKVLEVVLLLVVKRTLITASVVRIVSGG